MGLPGATRGVCGATWARLGGLRGARATGAGVAGPSHFRTHSDLRAGKRGAPSRSVSMSAEKKEGTSTGLYLSLSSARREELSIFKNTILFADIADNILFGL